MKVIENKHSKQDQTCPRDYWYLQGECLYMRAEEKEASQLRSEEDTGERREEGGKKRDDRGDRREKRGERREER
jgi:hypothetical protein